MFSREEFVWYVRENICSGEHNDGWTLFNLCVTINKRDSRRKTGIIVKGFGRQRIDDKQREGRAC